MAVDRTKRRNAKSISLWKYNDGPESTSKVTNVNIYIHIYININVSISDLTEFPPNRHNTSKGPHGRQLCRNSVANSMRLRPGAGHEVPGFWGRKNNQEPNQMVFACCTCPWVNFRGFNKYIYIYVFKGLEADWNAGTVLLTKAGKLAPESSILTIETCFMHAISNRMPYTPPNCP